jgi:hypothetical protein
MSLYQVSTRASRRRRIGRWLRTRWNWRVGSGRHHRSRDVPPGHAYASKVAQHALVPPGAPPSAVLADADRDVLVESDALVESKVPQQRPPSRRPSVYPNAYRAR